MKNRAHRKGATGRSLLIGLGLTMAVVGVGCSNDGSESVKSSEGNIRSVRYDDPEAVLAALTNAGIACSAPESGTFSYDSVGEVPYLSCEPENDDEFGSEIPIVTFETTQPSRELLDDITESIVVGENWAISVTGDNQAIADSIGGRAITVEERGEFPENPS